MSAASEESTADFLPKALQTGKKGDRAAETGRQKRGGRNGAAETGRQKRGDRNGRQKRAAGPGRQDRGGRNGAAGPGRQEADAGERAEGTGSRRVASKKPDKNTAKPNTDRKSPKPNTKIRKQRREARKLAGKARKHAGKARKQAGKARKQAGEPDAEEAGIPKAKRIGQGQKKGNSESRLIVHHPQFPHQPKTTNLNEP